MNPNTPRDSQIDQILKLVSDGHHRFEDIQRASDIPSVALTRILKSMVNDGLLERRRSARLPRRFEYFVKSERREINQINDRIRELHHVSWTLEIFLCLQQRSLRFEEIQSELGIARNILHDRLKTLVDKGIVEKRLYNSRPARYEYLIARNGPDDGPFEPSLVPV